MIDLTNAETALLGLLSEKPMCFNQIEQEVQYRDMNFWTELSVPSIKSLLFKLVTLGLVTVNSEECSEKPPRELYKITEPGMDALSSKIAKILSNVEHIRWQLDIGTYNCNFLPKDKVVESLGL